MSLSRFFYDPLTDFDRLFDEAFSARTGDTGVARRAIEPRALRPRMDVHEDPKSNAVTATFELPGLKKEDVSIDVQDNVLTISGESKLSSERDEGGYVIRERRYGKFSRALSLPQGVKPDDVKAALDNGVLTVTFPKATPEQAPKRITIA
ncbi:unnamed protein product [Somion occarium]|uniref:Small heat shock protein n=1 Tax=Somion occarium TaxID=3059160 RepID=A0ABP1CP76_9APHY